MSDKSELLWLGSREGIIDDVLAPWTPLKIEKLGDMGLRVECWGRKYEFEEGAFPSCVITADKSVTNNAISLSGSVDGQPIEWKHGSFNIEKETPELVSFNVESISGSLLMISKVSIEYDGLVRVDWTLSSSDDVTLDNLYFKIPLNSEFAKYVTRYPIIDGPGYTGYKRVHGREVPKESEGDIISSFCPYFWFGNEDLGLCWFCEWDKNWYPKDPSQACFVGRDEDEIYLKLELVGSPVKLNKSAVLDYTFGFQATPVRPNPEDVWDWRISHAGDYGIETLDPDAPAFLRFPAKDNIFTEQGTLELFVQPIFESNHAQRDYDIFTVLMPRGDDMRLFIPKGKESCKFVIRLQQDRVVELEANTNWNPGEFHHVALTWGDAIRIYKDGKLLVEQKWPRSIHGKTDGAVIQFGGFGVHMILDELRISDIARSKDEIAENAVSNNPPEIDDHTLLMERLNEAFEPGAIEHLDGYTGGYPTTSSAKAAGDWGWRQDPGGVIGFGRFVKGKFGNAFEFGLSKPLLDYLAEAGVRTICIHEQWTEAESDVRTMYDHKMKSLVKACHERGIKVLVYFGFLISDLTPEWKLVGEEVLAGPKRGYIPYDYIPQPFQNAYNCCYNSIWQDWLADGIAKMMDRYDADGVYLDGTALPIFCNNHQHGCGYTKEDGTQAPSFTFFAAREMMKRIYTIVKTRKPDGQVNVHQSLCITIPTLAWASSFWNGEQYSNIKVGPHALEVVPLEAFRIDYMGGQWGVPGEFLCYDRPFSYDQASAVTLLHDVLVRANGLGPHLQLQSKLWKIGDEFGRKESNWLPYWKNAEYVSTSGDGCLTSLYIHPKNGVLAVISNLSKNVQNCQIIFNSDKLGLNMKTVINAITGEQIPFASNKISFDLDSMDWKMVWIKP